MRTQIQLLKIVAMSLFAAVFTIAFSVDLSAQDTVKNQKTKTITILIDDGENGDTTILYSGAFEGDEFLKAQQLFQDQLTDIRLDEFHGQEYEKALQAFEEQMEEMEDQLKVMDLDLEDLPWNDSLDIERKIRIAIPDRVRMLERYHEPDVFCHPRFGKELNEIHRNVREETLSDVIGSIPMSAVKNYRVKKSKTGTRIYIQVMDKNMFGDRDEDVIIIRR